MKRNKREAGGTRYGLGAALPTAQLRVPQSQLRARGAAVQGTFPRPCCPHRVGTAAANATSLQVPNMNGVRARQEPPSAR